jgi:hypothetical protein
MTGWGIKWFSKNNRDIFAMNSMYIICFFDEMAKIDYIQFIDATNTIVYVLVYTVIYDK